MPPYVHEQCSKLQMTSVSRLIEAETALYKENHYAFNQTMQVILHFYINNKGQQQIFIEYLSSIQHNHLI